jgi:hypothetical protein
MKQRYCLPAMAIALAWVVPAQGQRTAPFMAAAPAVVPKPTPFANSNGLMPPPPYKGPLFTLSHGYPATLGPMRSDPPWRKAIGDGAISVTNAAAYVKALKDAVAADMRLMLADQANWKPGALGWYSEPWTGYLREATHGAYVGSSPFTPDLFKGSGLTKPFTTYVLTFYNARAANMMSKMWGTTALKPNMANNAPQMAEGSIVVKAAFSTANGDVWPVMQNALPWTLYISTNATLNHGETQPPELDPTSFFQFDIIVKDTASAPKTGWVFSTLVYDKDAQGDFWDKMVPLGAMWGNDPQATQPSQPLTENWINPAAPAYSKMTLGWGGRLSGPNDGAVNDAVVDAAPVPVVTPMLPSSSCMSCHSVAEWPMQSFLLPTATDPQQFGPEGFANSDYLVMWPPASVAAPDGTPAWMHWFQSRPGTQPADAKSVAFDYDMVQTFKSLNAWQQAQPNAPRALATLPRGVAPLGGSYNGRPFGAR